MALWPNNYSTASGWSPYRRFGITSLYTNTPVGGAPLNRFSSLLQSSSIPEGAAPRGAWAWPRDGRKGPMAAANLMGQVLGAAALKMGRQLVGTTTLVLTPSGSLKIQVRLGGTAPITFTVTAAQLHSVLNLAGGSSITFAIPDALLSILNPMSGSFTMEFDGALLLRGIANLTGTFNNRGEEAPAYGGAVYVAGWGTDAPAYPAGTATQPVQTLAGAKVIAERYNLHDIWITGEHVLTTTFSNVVFHGWGPDIFNEVDLNNQLLDRVKFIDCNIIGQLNASRTLSGRWQDSIASVWFEHCDLFAIEDLEGNAQDCQIEGATKIKAGGWFGANAMVVEGDFTVFDLRSTTRTTVSMDVVSGWSQFINAVDGCLIELNVKGGEVSLDASCVGGEYYLEGVGTLFNDSAMSVKENHFIVDDQTSYHMVPGSMALRDAETHGLVNGNSVLDNTVYNSRGVMTSGRIRVYPTAADADANTNMITEFTVTGTAKADPNDDQVDTFKSTG